MSSIFLNSARQTIYSKAAAAAATAAHEAKFGNRKVIVSEITDPSINLSILTYLTMKVGDVFANNILFLYSNDESLQLGPQKKNELEFKRLFAFIENKDGRAHTKNLEFLRDAFKELTRDPRYPGIYTEIQGNKVTISDGTNRIIVDSDFYSKGNIFRHDGTIYLKEDNSKEKSIKSIGSKFYYLNDYSRDISTIRVDRTITSSYVYHYIKYFEERITYQNFYEVIEDAELFKVIYRSRTQKD